MDYSRPAKRGSGVRAVDVLIAMLLIGACIAGAVTFVRTQHRPLTQARMQYEIARSQTQATQPSYTPPPYVGRTFEHVSPWGFGSTYVGIVLALLGVIVLVARLRRPGVAS